MDKKELLKIAKEKYPIGTVFISPYSSKQYIIDSHERAYFNKDGLQFKNKNIDFPYVYYDGKWAEIISTPNKSYELW